MGAFPHCPSSVLQEPGAPDTQWTAVTTTEGLREALQSMLQSSEVLAASLVPGHTVDDITMEAAANSSAWSGLFGLQLYTRDVVPSTCRQMFETVAAAYRGIASVDLVSREELHGLLRRYSIIPTTYQLPGLSSATEAEPMLLRFCAELAVKWLQPFFAQDSNFYVPPGSDAWRALLEQQASGQ